jgi:hypothetical protein
MILSVKNGEKTYLTFAMLVPAGSGETSILLDMCLIIYR